MTGGHRRVAIVHERFTEWGGSEQVVAQLHELWPDAPIFTSVVDPHILHDGLAEADVRPSRLQPLFPGGGRYAHLLPLLPGAMRHLDLGPVEVVIASHHAFANRVRVPDGAQLVSYVHTPARWLWDPSKRSSEAGGPVGRAALALFAASQRRADVSAAARVDRLVANSTAVATRIRMWWGREANVVAPPVDTRYFTLDPGQVRGDFFLLAGRLVPYKKPDVAVAAARRAGVRLVVAGDGRMRRSVEAAAGPETTVLGSVSRDELRHLYRTCRALVFPGDEDFGIVPVEAQACGAAVIARRCGGVLDSVVPGRTGVLYPDEADEVQALADALATFDPEDFDPETIRAHAETFSVGAFRNGMRHVVDSLH
jgi:glycosyltransferase involved in cell wall biosynthesis